MNVAITVWKNIVSPVFDSAKKILICNIDTDNLDNMQQIYVDLPEGSLYHKITCLVNNDVECLICGAISTKARSIVDNHNIITYPFITGDINEILSCYQAGNFPAQCFTMPGCQCRRRRCRRGKNSNKINTQGG